jgi:hypothetical protein
VDLLLVVIAVVLLGLAANRWGVDSRDGRDWATRSLEHHR